jgi:hypothetical protein
MARRRYLREQWQDWISEQADSGMSVAAFCRAKELPVNSFYAWRSKLAAELDGKVFSQATTKELFLPVSLRTCSQVEIDLPGGALVRAPAEESVLRQVLSVLWQLGRQP